MMSTLLALFWSFAPQAFGQEAACPPTEEVRAKPDLKFVLSTSWLSFSNFGNVETNTEHYELRLGYQLTPKDQVGVKLTTWSLFAPMGMNIWDPALLDREYFYPGRLQEKGVGVTYQRKLWKGLYLALEVLPLSTNYIDETGSSIGKGFKLYNSYHAGYHIPILKNGRLFIEPQVHVNHWPINTKVPASFKVEEDRWDNIFLIEPNLYLGLRF